MSRIGKVVTWAVLAAAMIVPIAIAATSPYLAYRGPAYLVGGFAGIICLSLLLIQPLLAAGYLPGAPPTTERRWHHRVGWAIITCVVLHVGGLYLTSPPDTLDALLLVAPTPFSVYGVLAMWGVLLTGVLVALRRRIGLHYSSWRIVHNALALVVVVATVIHAIQIEGAMGMLSKSLLCIAVLGATMATLFDLRIIRPLLFRRGRSSQPVRDLASSED